MVDKAQTKMCDPESLPGFSRNPKSVSTPIKKAPGIPEAFPIKVVISYIR